MGWAGAGLQGHCRHRRQRASSSDQVQRAVTTLCGRGWDRELATAEVEEGLPQRALGAVPGQAGVGGRQQGSAPGAVEAQGRLGREKEGGWSALLNSATAPRHVRPAGRWGLGWSGACAEQGVGPEGQSKGLTVLQAPAGGRA